jgi:hypothetical protein
MLRLRLVLLLLLLLLLGRQVVDMHPSCTHTRQGRPQPFHDTVHHSSCC